MICVYEANLGNIKKNTKNILQIYAIVLPASINVISLVAEESHEKCLTHNTGKALFCTTQQGILMKGMSQHSNPLNGFSSIPEHPEYKEKNPPLLPHPHVYECDTHCIHSRLVQTEFIYYRTSNNKRHTNQ
jgi:hypothetical protein